MGPGEIGVDPHAGGSVFGGPGSGEGGQCGFGGAVGGGVGLTDGASPAGDVDDHAVAAGHHFRGQHRHQQVGGLHVGGEQLIQRVDGQLCRRAEPGEPGIVDQDVDVADLLGQPQRLRRFAQVCTHEPSCASDVFDLCDHRSAPAGVTAVHYHRGALRGQLHRRGPADPRRRAGHQCDLAFQIPNRGRTCHDHS